MASNALECDICCNVFSEDNCPRNLPCSHTFCGPCIDGIIATQKKTCPTCRAEFTANSSEDLMICRIVLDVVKQLASINVKPKTLSKGPTGSFTELPKEFPKTLTKESIQETETRILGAKKILDEMKNVHSATETLKEMKDGLLGTKKEIGRFKEKLTDIEFSIEKVLIKINESGDQLEAATNLTSTDHFHDAQEKVKKIKDLLQKNQRETHDITKEIKKMKTRLGNIAEEMQESFGMETLVMSAVKVIGGKQMVAPVRVKPRNQVHLSHFVKGDVPPTSLLIKHEALMTTFPQKAFLDLAVGRTLLSRIIIRVLDESNLALNFLHVCAGDLGPSYANYHLSRVDRKGQAAERIFVGGQKASVLKLDLGEEEKREIYKRTPYKAGEVRGFLSDKWASAFYIHTRDHPFWTDNHCFGIVEEGLNALRDAILKYPDITAVRIVDCGLMFSL